MNIFCSDSPGVNKIGINKSTIPFLNAPNKSPFSILVQVTLEIVNGNIITYNHDGAEMFCHKIRNLQKLATASSDKSSVVYIYKDYRSTRENVQIKTYKCFLFILDTESKVSFLFF